MDLRLEKAETVAEEIRNNLKGEAIGLRIDATSKDAFKDGLTTTIDAFGQADILINGAGGNHPMGTTSNPFFKLEDLENKNEGFKSFFDLDPKGIEFTFNLNFLGTLLPTQVFAQDMVGRENCSILNISSMNAFTPLTKIPAYSGAKAAVSNFTQWLAVHFSKVGIRVNALAPGFFPTELTAALFDDPKTAADLASRTAMGRNGELEDLRGPLLFLASNAGAYITGQTINVDGGMTAK